MVCNYCQSGIDKDTVFCVRCGAKVQNQNTVTPSVGFQNNQSTAQSSWDNAPKTETITNTAPSSWATAPSAPDPDEDKDVSSIDISKIKLQSTILIILGVSIMILLPTILGIITGVRYSDYASALLMVSLFLVLDNIGVFVLPMVALHNVKKVHGAENYKRGMTIFKNCKGWNLVGSIMLVAGLVIFAFFAVLFAIIF